MNAVFTCLLALAFSIPSTTPVPPLHVDASPHAASHSRFIAMGQVDNHVLANLLADTPVSRYDLPLTVVAGEISRCEAQSCTVPLILRVARAQGPVTLAFAVANAKGEISDVQHAACGMGSCSVSLVLERGRNTISIGIVDGIAQTTAYTTLHIDANRNVAARPGKSEWF